jgi:hypothetical protein
VEQRDHLVHAVITNQRVHFAGRFEDEHPFALKFRLLEAGRWPIALVGASFSLF